MCAVLSTGLLNWVILRIIILFIIWLRRAKLTGLLHVLPYSVSLRRRKLLTCYRDLVSSVPNGTLDSNLLCSFDSLLKTLLHLGLINHLPNDVRGQHEIVFAQRNLAELAIDWGAGVIEWWRLTDDGASPKDTGQREQPEEEAVQHHRDELPVLDNLRGRKENHLANCRTE